MERRTEKPCISCIFLTSRTKDQIVLIRTMTLIKTTETPVVKSIASFSAEQTNRINHISKLMTQGSLDQAKADLTWVKGAGPLSHLPVKDNIHPKK